MENKEIIKKKNLALFISMAILLGVIFFVVSFLIHLSKSGGLLPDVVPDKSLTIDFSKCEDRGGAVHPTTDPYNVVGYETINASEICYLILRNPEKKLDCKVPNRIGTITFIVSPEGVDWFPILEYCEDINKTQSP